MVRFETERLALRDFLPGDLADYHSLLSDKAAMYYLDELATDTVEETRENLWHAIANADGHYFCVRDRRTGEFIGSVGYTVTDMTPLGGICGLGAFLLPRFHGRGYAPEASEAVMAFAFGAGGCIRITAGCCKDNEPSRKTLEKLGFRKEAERIKAQYHDGAMKDRLEYAMNRDEWLMRAAI